MNTEIRFTIVLLSDAETGSGLGSEIVNNIIARDHQDRPVIRASHLKGLLRDRLEAIGRSLQFPEELYIACFGRPGESGDGGISATFHISDAILEEGACLRTRTITRNSLTPLGVVAGNTLRTTEAVPAGTRFCGSLRLAPDAHSTVDLAVRLALLSIEAVGGNRNRGAGLCRVDIDGETRTPGTLLKQLVQRLQSEKVKPSLAAHQVTLPKSAPTSSIVLRLIFHALDPVCCPETPVVGTNVIRSGIAIPASAVLGAVISRLAQHDGKLADRTMASPSTRAWPLLPADERNDVANPPIPVRVSLSHRMSKLPDEHGNYAFRDAAVEPYDWRSAPSHAPLKGTDGVLLWHPDKTVTLWRSGDMPRLISAHAVHHGGRNLFTVEALAPMTFAGWISLPKDAAEVLLKSLAKNSFVTFGKSRSIRGGGRLAAFRSDFSALSSWHTTIFVLQSPVVLPEAADCGKEPAEVLLAQLVQDAGWGKVADPARQPHEIKTVAQAACGVRFGWNRHRIGTCVLNTQQLRARRVFLPGSVFVLQQAPSDLSALLVRGLGPTHQGEVQGRLQGFGAVMPHPGIATRRYQRERSLPTYVSESHGKWAFDWWSKTRTNSPSPAQISAVAERIKKSDAREAERYLQHQKERHLRIWERWSPVFEDVLSKLKSDPLAAQRALRTWRDLVVIHRDSRQER